VLIAFTDLEGNARVALRFEPGYLVRHRLYGYRGVVVSHDAYCMAGETWYQSNKTQPNKQQPWYHVLVHDSGGLSTYVAQSNLEPDESGVPIHHPRIGCYFAAFKNGRYILSDSQTGGCSI
jgi:heat shock protein HspQ